MDYKKHNEENAKLWEDYGNRANARVPVTIAFDEQFHLHRLGRTFRQYYGDVRTQVEIQLDGQKWVRENVLQDAEMGIPQEWNISPPCWMGENEFFGADIVVQENDYSWGMPLELSKAELLKKLQGIDVKERVQAWTPFRHYTEMTELVKDMEFCGRPVKTIAPLLGTHGIFTKAAEIRGVTQICADLYDDPVFVKELLAVITELTMQRIRIMHELAGTGHKFPQEGGWGMADDSLTLISASQYKEFVLPFHKKIYSGMGGEKNRSMHLCGHVQHLFNTLYREMGIRIFNGPGVQIDLGKMAEDTGADIEIQGDIGYSTMRESHPEIERVLDKMLGRDLKDRVKLMLYAFAVAGTTPDNMRFFYEKAKEIGGIFRVKES